MDTRQLRHFVAVVEHGTVTRAAQALFVAQPALSQTIRALERELGTDLFARVGRGLELSPAGRALLGPARQVLAGATGATETVRRIEELHEGRVEVAVTSELAVDPLADVLLEFRQRHPEVWVNVLPAADSDEAADLVRSAVCEIALCSDTAPVPGTVYVPLGARRLMLALPPGHPWQGEDLVALDRLGELALVAGPPGGSVRDLIEQECGRLDVVPEVRVEIETLSTHPGLVAAGAGAAVLPPYLARQAADLGAVLCTLDPPLVQSVGVLHRTPTLSGGPRELLAIAALLAGNDSEQPTR